MVGAWNTRRLCFRAIEAGDVAFLMELYSDIGLFHNAVPYPLVPRSQEECDEYRKYVADCLLGVVICLSAAEAETEPTPIGVMHLNKIPKKLAHHHRTEFGIKIIKAHQNQGYGGEAMRWALKWGFIHGHLHKIDLTVFEYNERAIKLYEKLGFVEEGRRRDHIWADGKYWALIEMGILHDEWMERREDERADASGSNMLPVTTTLEA